MAGRVKTVFITGANRGIGLELVKQMLDKWTPDKIIATYRSASDSKELLDLAKQRTNLSVIELDVRETEQYPRVIQKVEELTEGKGVNLVINNAGVLTSPPENRLSNLTKDNLWYHFEINTIAPAMLCKAFQPLLEKASKNCTSDSVSIGKAALVNISTLMASIQDNSSGGSIAYRCSKSALNSFTKTISLELEHAGIVTFMVHPGWVKTDMGGVNAPVSVAESAAGLINVMESANASYNGRFYNFNGRELPW